MTEDLPAAEAAALDTTLPVGVRLLLEHFGPRTTIAFGAWATERCPNCGGDVRAIDDPYEGYAENIVNFPEVATELGRAGDLKSRHYTGKRGLLTEPKRVAETICQEGGCRECDFSFRAFFPNWLVAVGVQYRLATADGDGGVGVLGQLPADG